MHKQPVCDSEGKTLETGDIVRVVRMQDLAGMSARGRRESIPVFACLVGRYRRIVGIDQVGQLELHLRIGRGRGAGIHYVFIDPKNVRKRVARGHRNRSASDQKQFPVGSYVIKDTDKWIPNDFDHWGRGNGVGVVVEPPFKLDPEHVDVRWPAGRCFEEVSGLLPAPKKRSHTGSPER